MTNEGISGNNPHILPDIFIFRSLGAMARNYDIMLPDGDIVNLTEGSRITGVEIIAGMGRNRQIDIIDLLVDKFGGNPDEWQKVKGFGYVNHEGESLKAELHWYQEPTVGRVDFKLKRQKGGEWFIYED